MEFTYVTGSVKWQVDSCSHQSRSHSNHNCLLKLGSKQQTLPKSYILVKITMHGLAQLMDQTKITVDIFEYLHPDKVGIWLGLAVDALNVNNMNVNPGGKQRVMQDTVIPLTNLPPKLGQRDTQGMPQTIVYPDTHPDLELRGKPKGIKVILQKYKLV